MNASIYASALSVAKQSASFHGMQICGLNRITGSKSFVGRIFWLLIFMLAFALMLFQVVILLESYFTYPVHVEIKQIHQKELRFSAVTICNVNPFAKSKMESSVLGRVKVSIFFYYLGIYLVFNFLLIHLNPNSNT